MMPLRSGLFLPIFGELADPTVVAGLSVGAEEAGCMIAYGAENRLGSARPFSLRSDACRAMSQ
jgi:hypothetical protein